MNFRGSFLSNSSISKKNQESSMKCYVPLQELDSFWRWTCWSTKAPLEWPLES